MASKMFSVASIVNKFRFDNAVHPLLLHGKPLAACIETEIKRRVDGIISDGRRPPQLGIILATDKPASATYVKKKLEACARVGIRAVLYQEDSHQHAIGQRITQLNEDPGTDGIILQLPVPGLDTAAAIDLIDPSKDIDGLTVASTGALVLGRPGFVPCTPLGIYVLLTAYGIDLVGKHVVIVGKSDTVGSPLGSLLSRLCQAMVTQVDVTCTHEQSIAARKIAKVQVIAVGRPRAFRVCLPGAIMVDVGINHITDAANAKERLVGDVDIESVINKVSAITPVPGGVGPMTVSMVALNTLAAYQSRELGASIQDVMATFLTDDARAVIPRNAFRTKIMLVASANNGMTQLINQTLRSLGYTVSLHVTSTEDAMLQHYRQHDPDLIIGTMLKQKIPESIYRKTMSWIVHPGITGDRGPSSIDWAIMERQPEWGVTVLEATEVMDGGDIWATNNYPVDSDASKSELYNAFATGAAKDAVIEALSMWHKPSSKGTPLDYHNPEIRGSLKPVLKQDSRQINWGIDTTENVIRKVRASDGFPGVLNMMFDGRFFLYDAHPESRIGKLFDVAPGTIIAVRDRAVCFKTTDGAMWIGHIRQSGKGNFKLPATQALPADRINDLPIFDIDFRSKATYPTLQDVCYTESGDIGTVTFDFYNGAMRVDQCHRLKACIEFATSRPTKVIVLKNDRFLFSNGINLNTIEYSANPMDEAWESINAIDDVVQAILLTPKHITICAMGGNAGAGGVAMARAADLLVCPKNTVFNPHYKMMGLFGSEYWTHILPKAIGHDLANETLERCEAMTDDQAEDVGLVDFVVPRANMPRFVNNLAHDQVSKYHEKHMYKQEYLQQKEKDHPLAMHRHFELRKMHANIFDDNWGFAEKRHKFVMKI